MDPLKSIWRSFVSDGQRPPDKDSQSVVVDTLMNELDYHIKELERLAKERENDERRRRTGVDYSWLVSTPSKGYEIPQLQRLELEEVCYRVKSDECGRILALFRDALYNEPKASQLPKIMRACIHQVTEQRPKEESLTEWVTRRTLSLTRIRPNPKVSPTQRVDPENQDQESTRRCYSLPVLQAPAVKYPSIQQDILPV